MPQRARQGDAAHAAHRDAELFSSARDRVSVAAGEMLTVGVDTLGQAEVAAALQVFFNLGSLRAVALELVAQRADAVAASLRAALDARQLTGMATGAQARGRASAAGGVRIQDVLWRALDESMGKMHTQAVAIWHVQRVVSKKRDPLKLTLFADVIQVRALPVSACACRCV
jgi:conserved oligomeric Golgi complex subunit 5